MLPSSLFGFLRQKKHDMHSTEETKHSLDSPAVSPRPSKISRYREEEEEEEERDEASMSHRPGIQRYLVAIEYIGTRFSGSQKQPNFRTVIGTLEDAGVHALCNVCHVDVERSSKRKPGEVLTPHEPGVVRRAVNHFLQKEGDITVTDVRCVPTDFHARFKALERTWSLSVLNVSYDRYFYRVLSGPEPLSAFEKERAWHVPEELNITLMKNACSILVGHHDFSSFRASGCQALSPIRTLDELHVCELVPSPYFPSVIDRKELKPETPQGSLVDPHMCIKKLVAGRTHEFGHKRSHRCYVITARARSFLYHQVRLLVGLLKSVGTGEIPLDKVEEILNAKSVTATSPMAPGCGLYLGNVKYDLPDLDER